MSNILPTVYQQFIHKRTYARWLPEENRREHWDETVDRYVDYMEIKMRDLRGFEDPALFEEIRAAILGLEVMPSMRAMMTAGPALDRDNIAAFNCSYVAIDDIRAFDEIAYILMCGTGVGFSVERQFVNKLPEIPAQFDYSRGDTIFVEDSKTGWAVAIRELIDQLYKGIMPSWDVSNVRPAGARLKTFGGRASGPGPLVDFFQFAVESFMKARGRRFNSIEVHDLVCKIGEVIVSGGVRRSALISLSNLSDDRMRSAKSGEWWNSNPHRRLANNSVAYTEKPEIGRFMQEWMALYESKSGERGIFNRNAAIRQCEDINRVTEIDGQEIAFGTNPCGEIILRSMQFCNLTEVVARAGDTGEDLKRKVRLATILGTFQSCLTNYEYIRPQWKKNSEEERLLGVSITGIMDCPLLNDLGHPGLPGALRTLRSVARMVNAQYAGLLGINASAAITCVKPSGTVSQLVDSASGIHGRPASSYVRRVRHVKKDPLTAFMEVSGVPAEDDVFKPTDTVFSFPQKAPPGAITKQDISALDQLELWKIYKENWCEHNPSVTISVREHEWMDVGAWVYRNFDIVGGLSFLPLDDHIYQQAPEEPREDLSALEASMPSQIDWSLLVEHDDDTTGSRELACVSGHCEI